MCNCVCCVHEWPRDGCQADVSQLEEGETETESSFIFDVCVRDGLCLPGCVCVRVCVRVEAAQVNTHTRTQHQGICHSAHTRCFSVLLLPWKQRRHGNHRCQFFGEVMEVGVFPHPRA